MKYIFCVIGLITVNWGCIGSVQENSSSKSGSNDHFHDTLVGDNIASRFGVPDGFERLKEDSVSFGHYLRELPLKPKGSPLLAYNGGMLEKEGVYAAVVDLPIGNKDLHQCADAVMRLRAEYLWRQRRYDEIHFHFTNGFDVAYSKWMQGFRIVIEGNKTYWNNSPKAPSNTHQDFWSYMETIFMYAGTLSLSKEMDRVEGVDMKIGDVFIQGGSPGHAVIVVDMAVNPENQERVFMLAQSYMPAQQLQILINPSSNDVWYNTKELYPLVTPEWTFESGSLKQFKK